MSCLNLLQKITVLKNVIMLQFLMLGCVVYSSDQGTDDVVLVLVRVQMHDLQRQLQEIRNHQLTLFRGDVHSRNNIEALQRDVTGFRDQYNNMQALQREVADLRDQLFVSRRIMDGMERTMAQMRGSLDYRNQNADRLLRAARTENEILRSEVNDLRERDTVLYALQDDLIARVGDLESRERSRFWRL